MLSRVCRTPAAVAAPNHIKAIWKVFISESWLFKKLFNLEIGFTVSSLVAWVGCGRLAGHASCTCASLLQTSACHTHASCNFLALQVTKKKVAGEEEPESHWEDLKRALRVTWPHLLYYVALTAGTIYFIVRAALGCFK